MKAPGRELRVMYVSGDDVRPAIVPDADEEPWKVLLEGEKGEVDWEVVVLLAAAPPLVFDTSQSARDWATETIKSLAWWLKPGPSYPEEIEEQANREAGENADAATGRVDELAREHGLDPGSTEAISLAHAQKAITTVCLYDRPGCPTGGGGRYKVFDKDVGDVSSLVDWTPKSCWASVGLLYEQTYGWRKPGGKKTGVAGNRCRDSLPHRVRSLRVQ